MIRRREAIFIAAILAALLPMPAMSDSMFSGNSSPLCLVPVKSGQPTKADVNQSFRMTSKVVVMPGLDRPIIFPSNRGGVWTIDADGAYVPFGGDFPNHYQNEYASDTSTGDVIGVSWKLGVFVLRPGDAQFKRVYAADGKPFINPFSAAYVARFGGTVIADNSGLYLLHSTGRVEPLYWDARVGGTSPGKVFDLPELKLLLITGNEGHIYTRADDGTLALFDNSFAGVGAVRVTVDGSIFLKRPEEKSIIVPWPPQDPTRPPAEQGIGTLENFEGVEMHVNTLTKVHGKQMSVYLPSGVLTPPKEFPGGIVVADAGTDGLYTLNADNKWDLVDHSHETAGYVTSLFPLPVQYQALLFNGKNGLFLLVRKTDARAAGCLR